MAEVFQRVGCMDRLAINWDSSATIQCNDCCDYAIGDSTEGCTDKLATNFNPSATLSCVSCCQYRWNEYQESIITDTASDSPPAPPAPRTVGFLQASTGGGSQNAGGGGTATSQYYTLNTIGAQCIADTGYEDQGWIVAVQSRVGTSHVYGPGYLDYIEQLYSYGTSAPNFGQFGTIANIEAAFNILLSTRGDSRVYINNTDLTPWIIPTVLHNSINPNQNQFVHDCTSIGGTVYNYQGTTVSSGWDEVLYEMIEPGPINGESDNTFNVIHNLDNSEITVEDVWISIFATDPAVFSSNSGSEGVNIDYQDISLADLNDSPIEGDQLHLDLVSFTVLSPNEIRFVIRNNSVGTVITEDFRSISIHGTTDSITDAFMACLCEPAGQPWVPEPCQTIVMVDDKFVTPEDQQLNLQQITKNNAECVRDLETFKKLFTNQYQLGWRGEKTTFFNDFVLSSLGISLDDISFILENILNTNQAIYPYQASDAGGGSLNSDGSFTASGNLDTHTGQQRCYLILEKAFSEGANLWFPANSEISTDIIHKQNCCDSVGGLYKSGIYNTYRIVGKNRIIKENEAGVCLCNEITPPCPTFADGLKMVTKDIESDTGIITITTIPGLTKECCSNESLQSTLDGNWTWIPGNSHNVGVCQLQQSDNSNACDESTIITISETPINVKDINCLNDIITISAYIYFEEPNSRCTNGILTTDNSDRLTDEMLGLFKNPPETTNEISQFSKKTWSTNGDNREIITKSRTQDISFRPQRGLTAAIYAEEAVGGGVGISVDGGDSNQNGNTTHSTNNKNCCYDTETPIQGQIVIQDENFNVINPTSIEYVDTFSSTQTNINTNTNVGQGFGKWIRLTTTVSLSDLNTITSLGNNGINVAVEFTDGLYKCCDYNIFFDDIEVGCLKTGFITTYQVEPCVGYDLSSCVIDNKKSWVYNPGKDEMSDNTYDKIVRQNGSRGMNIEQTGIIKAGGHGAINRVFAPSVDAELDFRDTDYFNFHGVIEKHSKLVLNSKQLILQFNMCPDDDCLIDPSFLVDDYGNYVLDDDGGRIVVGPYTPFPNLIELERFKKTFQGFWIQFIEQFIPATTIFVAGEKWCNNRICEEKVVADYLLDARGSDLSPLPVSDNITETPNPVEPNISTQNTPITEQSNEPNETTTNGGEKGTTSDVTEPGPIVVGNYKLYATKNIDPDLGNRVLVRSLT